MNTYNPSVDEIRTVTHTLIDKRTWAEQLLPRVRAVIHAKGKDRLKGLRQLELAIQMEIDDTRLTKTLYQTILDNTETLRKQFSVKHAPLSENDLFLCACIYLSIPMTDVSEIKAVAPSSVIMGRYRLKKKLGLSLHDDLETYIQNGLNTD
jgi:hypothetical protein